MRKVCFLLTALLLVSQAFALDVDCSVSDTNLVTVYYANATEANLPRAFGLDITVDNGATIDSLESYDATNFWVYPGNIVIDGNSVTEANEPIAKFQVAGREEEGIGTSGITIEMGSLYNDPCDPQHQAPPPLSGTLLEFRVSGDCNIAIAANAARGGVVLENPDVPADANFGGCAIIGPPDECYTGPDYAEWVAVGKPTQWCNPRQCYGDADGIENDYGRGQKAWVSTEDVGVLVAGYRQSYGGDPSVDTWIAADFDHTNNDYGRGQSARVSTEDVAVLVNYYRASSVPTDCLD